LQSLVDADPPQWLQEYGLNIPKSLQDKLKQLAEDCKTGAKRDALAWMKDIENVRRVSLQNSLETLHEDHRVLLENIQCYTESTAEFEQELRQLNTQLTPLRTRHAQLLEDDPQELDAILRDIETTRQNVSSLEKQITDSTFESRKLEEQNLLLDAELALMEKVSQLT